MFALNQAISLIGRILSNQRPKIFVTWKLTRIRIVNGNLLKLYTQQQNDNATEINEEVISEKPIENTDKTLEIEKSEDSEKEEGELDSSEKSSDESEPKNIDEWKSEPVSYSAAQVSGDNSNFGGRASAIRAIITKCRLSSGLTVGDLHLITIDGYTFGSDSSNDLVAADLQPFHCWINYDASNGDFTLHTTEPIGIISHPDHEEYYFKCESEIIVKHGMSIELGSGYKIPIGSAIHMYRDGPLMIANKLEIGIKYDCNASYYWYEI